jgi:hypothetical protein
MKNFLSNTIAEAQWILPGLKKWPEDDHVIDWNL